MLNNLNYIYISVFLSVSRLFHSVRGDVGQIIPMQLEFPQLKFIPQCFYLVKYIINRLILSLQVIMKIRCQAALERNMICLLLITDLQPHPFVIQHQKCLFPGRSAVQFYVFFAFITCVRCFKRTSNPT